ncbi:MAG: TlpA family protein disulfide reductase [Gammaproteobacteria bacterium]|nr:TlpA family protein disulfide reductase [Gammaproteobacteria bacterium]
MTPYFPFLFRMIGLALVLLSTSVYSADTKQLFGKQQPGFTLTNLEGQVQSESDWQNKVLVINFWASWCTPCRKEIPLFNRLQKEYGPDGVQFIGIAVDTRDAVLKFIQKTPIDYPVFFGTQEATRLTQDYGNTAGVLPYTVFVDRRGRIQTLAPGQLNETYTRKHLEKLL